MFDHVANAVNEGFSEFVEVKNDTNPLTKNSYIANEDGLLHLPWYHRNIILYYMNGTVKVVSRCCDAPITTEKHLHFFPLRNRSAYDNQLIEIVESRMQLKCTSELRLPRLMMFVEMSKIMFETHDIFKTQECLINVKTQLTPLIYKLDHLHTLEQDALWANAMFEALWRAYSGD